MPLSYLAVLKRSLFATPEQPATPATQPTYNKNLKDDWILIHDEESSQTEEILDLTDQKSNFTLCGTNTINSDGSTTFHLDEQKQREILLNRDLWLQKQNKIVKALNMTKSSKFNRSKIMKRKRNSKSTSSNSNAGKINNQAEDTSSQDKLSVKSLDPEGEHKNQATVGVATGQTTSCSNAISATQNFRHKSHYLPVEANGHALNKTFKKMKTMQNNKKSRMITQPIAKCLC